MKMLTLAVLIGSMTLAASTAWAAGPLPDQQTQARNMASKLAVDSFRRGPINPSVKTLPSEDRRGKDVKVGDSTYSWRGNVNRGRITVSTTLPNGSETVEQRRGFFRNYATLTRKTSEWVGGARVETETTATTKRTFWKRQVSTTETTDVSRHVPSTERGTATKVILTDDKQGRFSGARAVVTKEGSIPTYGDDKGAVATVRGKPGAAPGKPEVVDMKPYNHAEYIRSMPKPIRWDK